MDKNVITGEQFQHLPELHRLVMEQKIRKAEWILVKAIEQKKGEL